MKDNDKKQETPRFSLERFLHWGGNLKKNISFYKLERFVLFLRNISFCGLYLFMSILFFNYDFGVIYLPFGARVFVVQTAVCVTKTHLANIKS